MVFQLLHLTLLPFGRIKRSAPLHRNLSRERQGRVDPQQPGERLHRFRRSRTDGRAAAAADQLLGLKPRPGQRVDAIKLRLDAFELRRLQIAFLVGNGRHLAVFDDQTAWRNERRQFCIAKLAQQPPDVAVDGFGPDGLTRVEVTANQRSVDARVHGSRVKCNQPTLAVTGHPNLPIGSTLSLEPVHSG